MIPENIVLQSAVSLSIAVLSLIMTILQIMFFLRKPKFTWFGWSAAISFSSMIYAVGVFLEYNTLGPVNRFAGILEFTAIIFLVHCLYGFTFVRFKINSKYYHIAAGIFHCLILLILWTSDYIVADKFAVRNFTGLEKPFIEPDLGPAGILFELYTALSCLVAIGIWLTQKSYNIKHRNLCLVGMIFWIALGIHDGLASLGFPAFQYLMEYGFLGFSAVILWIVFENFTDISTVEKYHAITEYANDGILMIQDGEITFANPACNRLIGLFAENSPVEEILDNIADEDRGKLILRYRNLMRSIETSEPLIIRIKKTQEEKIIEIRDSLINYRKRKAILAIVRDITQRIREEEALKESEKKILRLRKMETMGLLAGGVAHDLNNVLTGIVSYPELILLKLPEDSPIRRPIQIMRDAGLKAAAIVQDLLTTVRGVAVPQVTLNLNDIILEYFRSPEYQKLLEYHPAVTVKKNLDLNLLNIIGSQVHLGKIVMNLISNACEAINDSGIVVISTMNRYLDRPLKRYEDVKTGEYVILTVEDSGTGIPEEDLDRIFEPFFTKKVMGRSGTGLGLTVVWNTVQDHNGYIDMISRDNGTKFELYFPASRDAVADENSIIPIKNLYGHGELILVIDDVESQREIICRMLETLKYKTKSFPGGEEAISYLKEHSADMVVLDMIMDPGINGRETYERIRKIHPAQKAIIVSGFAETDDVMKTLAMGAGRFLKKPVIMEELGLAVKKELEK
ncbi:MAG: response regulator [Spirochaetes bacterium]|nr:response regulator [Spirochaetota bacterium]